MRPPLGDQDPETRHLNLTWTVADEDNRRGFRPTNVKGSEPTSIVTWRHGRNRTVRTITRHVPRE
jgi:hypothetical protein